ncbi:hypothetical protein DAETH_12000 [Deinococcus aetherius]|uniref:Uncharacterized protein n=1 Tax=Deinococcus aetherius TaxID=200252 RepID=A0ABM8ABU3_9DEIO|nr:hypothetical protein [Deinococcus aetherius]BDP41231.1 hypothetical protein DAETH_12000 [Deinococcus aetherius]
MTDSENRYGDTPLGRSVEEVEREGGNLENPPAADGELWQGDEIALPAVANANTSAVPAVLDPDVTPDGTDPGGGDDSR